ncbi:hypothetical protein [Streptomyces sp. NPDC051704]|uniref:hypothetical protein n=1 Tax=Streptomyces sp. NPDC051704 TaxID=3365671 RepID=UPI0037B4D3FB
MATQSIGPPRRHGGRVELLVPPSEVVGAPHSLFGLPVADVTVEEAGPDEAFLALYPNDAVQEER